MENMYVKEEKIKDLENLGFTKGRDWYNLKLYTHGTSYLRVNAQTGLMDLNSRKANGTYNFTIPSIIVKMIKEDFIKEI